MNYEFSELRNEWRELVKQEKEIRNKKDLVRNKMENCKAHNYTSLIGDSRFEDMKKKFIDEGKSMSDIAVIYGFTREYVRQILKAGGVTGKDKLDDVRNKVIRLVNEGKTLEFISKEVGMEKSSLQGFISRHKIKNPETEYERHFAERDKKIIELYIEGLTQKEIAKKFNVAQTNVSRVLIKHGENKEQVSIDDVFILHNQGLNHTEISKKLGTSPANVGRILKARSESS